jgi:Ca2+-binding RTX toxin-like protein
MIDHNGQNGVDTLAGGSGVDTLSGGSGSDVFVFENLTATVTVTDFTDGADKIDVSGFGFTDYTALQSAILITQSGSNTLLEYDPDTSMTIQNLTATSLGSDDFVF